MHPLAQFQARSVPSRVAATTLFGLPGRQPKTWAIGTDFFRPVEMRTKIRRFGQDGDAQKCSNMLANCAWLK
jgi:hypothetical protein